MHRPQIRDDGGCLLPHGVPTGLQGRANVAREGDAHGVAGARARCTACAHAWRQGRSGDVCKTAEVGGILSKVRSVFVQVPIGTYAVCDNYMS